MPLQELCGAMTALSLAAIEILGHTTVVASSSSSSKGNVNDPTGASQGTENAKKVLEKRDASFQQRRTATTPSLLSLLWPAICLHSMANFRGLKPFFVWNSKRPWDELQLQVSL
jgi:hypothetical protein